MKRRQFMAATAASALAISRPRLFALDPDNVYRKEIGIQLYTLRNQIDGDVKSTLQAVADAGYQQVEMYGFPDCDPMIDAAKAAGLSIRSTHFAWDAVVEPEKKGTPSFTSILDKANRVGLEHLVIPYLHGHTRKNLDDYKSLAEKFNRAAEESKKAGIQLAYHNHAFEFEPMEGGMCGYDIFAKEFSPEMQFEIDVFWIQVGGHDPVKTIRELKGRVSQLHLKDLNRSIDTPNYGSIPNEAFEELGDGVIPVEPIIDVAAEAGVKICHVEQDQSPDPLASIRQSMGHLKSL